MKRYFILLILAFVFNSCIKTIEFDDKTLANRLVFNAQIMPSDIFTGTIRKSTSILSNASNLNVENGSVKLFENGNLQSEFTFQNGYFAKPQLSFKEGKTYRVKITADNQTISAETTIPEPAPVLQIDTVTIIGKGSLEVSITFKDNSGTAEYYRVAPFEIQTFILTDDKGNSKEYETSISPHIVQDDPVFNSVYSNLTNNVVDLNPENSYNIFPDDYFDGKEYKLKFEVESYRDNGYSEWGSFDSYGYHKLVKRRTTVYFQKISKDLYNYLKYLKLYDTYKDNPIAEPVPVYSNIKNGVGIFAGLTINAQLKWEKTYKVSN